MLSKTRKVAILAAVAIAGVMIFHLPAVVIDEPIETTHKSTTAPVVEETLPPTQVPTTAQPTVSVTEPAVTTAATTTTAPPVTLYDVPLDRDLQLFIINVAESNGVDPSIVFAIIWRESSFNPSAIGDNGESFGLMQIQPKWNWELMAQLNCTDLLDPYQNVTVGVAILANQRNRYGGDIAKAIVSYNQGHYYGTVTDYAHAVLQMAYELRGTTYETEE